MESKLEFPQSAILTPYNYFEWKPKIQLHLRSRGLFRITMETEVEPTSAMEKSRYFNRMDEAFGILCFSISPELLFHVESCSTPNEVWKILEELFGKQNEMLRMVEDSIATYRNSRENFSLEPEDPHVASLYATNYVQGLQETDDGDPNQSEGTIRGTGCANVACTGNEPKKDNVAAMAASLATISGQAQAMNPALTSMSSLNSPLQTLNPPLNPGLSSTLNPALSNSLLGVAPPLHHSGPFPAFYDQHPQPPPQHSQPLYSQSRSDYEPVTRSFKGLSGPLPSDVAAELYNVLNGAMCGISAKFKPPWPLDHLLAALAWAAPTWQVVPTRSQIPLVSFKEPDNETQASHLNQLRFRGKQFSSSWLGSEDSWWADYGYSSALSGWKDVFTKAGGKPNYFFVPFFPTDGSPGNEQAKINQFNDIIDGLMAWDTSAWPDYDSALQTPSGDKDSNYLKACNDRGKVYMATPSPWFFKDTPGSCQVKGNYKGPGLWLTRWQQIISLNPPLVEIVTWNDWVESSYVAPPFNVAASDVASFTHHAFLDLGEHYIRWYKTGKQPSVTQDSLYLFYYTHSKNAKATADLSDDVYVTAVVTQPASVVLTSGSVSRTFSASAGIQTFSMSFNEGQQSASLKRGGAVIKSVSGGIKITNSGISCYNFNVYFTSCVIDSG